jgi:hypothetical protein
MFWTLGLPPASEEKGPLGQAILWFQRKLSKNIELAVCLIKHRSIKMNMGEEV